MKLFRIVDGDGKVVSGWNRTNEFYPTKRSAEFAVRQLRRGRTLIIQETEIGEWNEAE